MKADLAADDFRARIDRLVEYVESRPRAHHSLERLAEIAGFPAAHLRRIFLAITGEPLGAFVTRAESGGAGGTTEATPSTPDAGPRRGLRAPADLHRLARERGWRVELVDLPRTDVVFVAVGNARRHGAELLGLYVELLEWLAANGVDEERVGLIGMSHEGPELREYERPGFEWAASPVPDAPLPRWLEARSEPELTVARVLVRGPLEDEDLAWQYLYRAWLPESGFEPSAEPAREIYRSLPHLDGWRTHDLWCALPVVPRPGPTEDTHV